MNENNMRKILWEKPELKALSMNGAIGADDNCNSGSSVATVCKAGSIAGNNCESSGISARGNCESSGLSRGTA